MEIKTVAMTKENGSRNVKVCNGIRNQMVEKLIQLLADAGFAVNKAANGDIAVDTVIDEVTGEMYRTRLAVSLSAKALDEKPKAKVKEKAAAEDVEVPELF